MVAAAKYDLTIYGATGFTGTLAARYVDAQYGNSIRWAIGGRSEPKLRELAVRLVPLCGTLARADDDRQASLCASPAIIVADGGDESALRAMCSQTLAVATCAGPFSRYGTKLVEACVNAGCAYSDITGEVDWVREMIATYDDAARKTGARIVHLCGHDSVPWDLSTLMCAKKLKAGGEELVSIDFYDEINSRPSGGTLETALGIASGADKAGKTHSSLGFDPLLKTRDSTKAAFGLSPRNVATVAAGGAQPRSFFVMCGVNANAVKRSNALLGYGSKVVYREGAGAATLLGACAAFAQLALFGALLLFPPTRFLLRKFVLPKPGEGPSEEFMATGFLNVRGVAEGSKGGTVESMMRFKVDPGYKDTARMVVESALALALEPDKCATGGGVFTPAACQGETLLNRLLKTGTTFEIH